ncbi:MAG: hypothetical protein R3195_02150 [Gemmatimonadota bacterium]|nr:hypothetical protein [Gemmatimonadota bacterium]
MQRLGVALIVGAVAALTACGDDAIPEGSTASLSLSAGPVLVIGRMDGSDEYLFQTIVGTTTLPGGEIAVADDGFKNVRVYDTSGEMLAGMGSAGAGPGQFLSIRGIWTTPEGTIGVFDPVQLRVTTFFADGTLATSPRLLPPPPDELPPRATLQTFLGSFSDGSIGVGWMAFGDQPSVGSIVPDRYVLGRFSAKGPFLGMLGEETYFDRTMFSSNMGGPVAFSRIPHAVVFADSLYFTDGVTPAIEVRDRDGVAGRSIPLPVEPPDVDQALAALAPLLSSEGPFNTPEQLEASPRPESIPVVSGLLVDELGFVWVRRYAVPDDALWVAKGVDRFGGEWLVFDPRGAPGPTLRLPGGFRPLVIEPDRILGIQVDEFDVQRLAVYGLNRGGEALETDEGGAR